MTLCALEDGKLILQGMEDGRGWSLVIVEETGKMSAAIAGSQVGFVVSGNCTTLEVTLRIYRV